MVGIKCKPLVHDNFTKQDVAGPQLSKEGVKEAMKEAKRVDKVAPNMILNKTILDHYHNELLGGGAWTTNAKKKMREKYFIS